MKTQYWIVGQGHDSQAVLDTAPNIKLARKILRDWEREAEEFNYAYYGLEIYKVERAE